MSFTEELHTRDPMKSQSMHYSGRRSRRGRRKRSVIRGGGAQPTKPKPTFWQRVIAFFKGPQVAVPPKPVERPVQDGATKTPRYKPACLKFPQKELKPRFCSDKSGFLFLSERAPFLCPGRTHRRRQKRIRGGNRGTASNRDRRSGRFPDLRRVPYPLGEAFNRSTGPD